MGKGIINKSCEPTYEELKLFEKLQTRYNLDGCEPTYEELKLDRGTDKGLGGCVASLPMRN